MHSRAIYGDRWNIAIMRGLGLARCALVRGLCAPLAIGPGAIADAWTLDLPMTVRERSVWSISMSAGACKAGSTRLRPSMRERVRGAIVAGGGAVGRGTPVLCSKTLSTQRRRAEGGKGLLRTWLLDLVLYRDGKSALHTK